MDFILPESWKETYKNSTKGLDDEKIQWIFAFTLGIIFAPWSWGFLYYIIFLFSYEFFYYCCYKWSFRTRFGVVILSLFGFLLGRIIVGIDPI